jgi:hypothetical protein
LLSLKFKTRLPPMMNKTAAAARSTPLMLQGAASAGAVAKVDVAARLKLLRRMQQ